MLTLVIGVQDSGKTHHMQQLVFEHTRSHPDAIQGTMVPDFEYEWVNIPKNFPRDLAKHVTTVRNLNEAVYIIGSRKAKLVIIRPYDYSDENRMDLTISVARWVMEKPGRGIAITEAHRVMPNGKRMHPVLNRLITGWRHAGIDDSPIRGKVHVWLDTQRFALINTTTHETTSRIYLHAMSGHNDLDLAKKIGGADLVAAVQECARPMSENPDNPEIGSGYYVELRPNRLGPYKVQRTKA